MVATTIQAVANFTADRIVDMTFNHTSLSEKDCILLALFLGHGPRDPFARSEPFSVNPADRTSTWTAFELSLPTSGTAANIPASNTASCVPLKAASRARAIVGSVFGFLAIWCMVSASICIMIRRRKGMMLPGIPFCRPLPTTPTPFPLYFSNTSFLQGHGTQAQSKVSRAHLKGENARLREEIVALEERMRRMETRCGIPPPPSYRSA
ncbi:hypothetical protein ARMGADRAFT_457506 [Armillaria gallica]|uniref:Uncharacterized protein n=1 Tax=Armillaria gallica TaxID=47427 RepID=A0A2H3CWV4_ARMGA|nr:hypothetical protein ARMGADRAFT_457506 [Armillaria gallica]